MHLNGAKTGKKVCCPSWNFFSLRIGEGQHHFIYANMSVNIFYYSSSLGVKANQSNRTLDPGSVPWACGERREDDPISEVWASVAPGSSACCGAAKKLFFLGDSFFSPLSLFFGLEQKSFPSSPGDKSDIMCWSWWSSWGKVDWKECCPYQASPGWVFMCKSYGRQGFSNCCGWNPIRSQHLRTRSCHVSIGVKNKDFVLVSFYREAWNFMLRRFHCRIKRVIHRLWNAVSKYWWYPLEIHIIVFGPRPTPLLAAQ